MKAEGSAHVATGRDGHDVRVAGELLERDWAVHAATGISMMVEADEVGDGELGSGAGVCAVLLDVGDYGQDVKDVAFACAPVAGSYAGGRR
jgi:hypothetical protein